MSSQAQEPPPSQPIEVRLTAALAAIAAWTIIVPFLGDALGLAVNVRTIVEVVDHVLPGLVVVAAALYLNGRARRGALASDRTALLASAIAFLAGFWVLATHVPLVVDANEGRVGWDAAIWHSLTALPIVGLSLWCAFRSLPPD